VTLASGEKGDEDALPIRADARVLGVTLKAGQRAEYQFADGDRYGYLVLSKGRADVNGVMLDNRDGAAIHGEHTIAVVASEDTELVLVDAIELV
jgi:redox-sensitive bicupin YhaK (pirin superfamily)